MVVQEHGTAADDGNDVHVKQKVIMKAASLQDQIIGWVSVLLYIDCKESCVDYTGSKNAKPDLCCNLFDQRSPNKPRPNDANSYWNARALCRHVSCFVISYTLSSLLRRADSRRVSQESAEEFDGAFMVITETRHVKRQNGMNLMIYLCRYLVNIS